MTTVSIQNTTCPICSSAISVRHIMSTNSFGGQDSDFRRRPVGMDPLKLAVAQCAECGYADYSHGFSSPHPLDEAIRQRIRAALQKPAQAIQWGDSRIYTTMAQIAVLRGAPDEDVANLHLRAAWCCADEADAEGERAHRLEAIRLFEAALEKNEVRANQYLSVCYLVGELYRRVGDTDAAQTWFDHVIAFRHPDGTADSLSEIALRQRDNPQDRF